MLAYSLIMLAVGGLLLALSIAVYKGRTDLIHAYHQTKVKDKAAYGRAFGKAMFLVSAAPLLSGIISLLGNGEETALTAVAVLVIGMLAGLCWIAAVQKKYNGGFF